MMADDIVAIARACIGTRFRPWGRNRELGLDCVGLAARAFGVEAPRDYALRGGEVAGIEKIIARTGLVRVPLDAPATGDLLLLDETMGQLHLAVSTGDGFVHADARLGRIVETPGRPTARIISIWRKEH